MRERVSAPPGQFSVILIDTIERSRFPQGLDFTDRSLAITARDERNEARTSEVSRYAVVDDQGQELP